MESNNMSVVDNQPASAAVFNAAFVSKTTDNSIAANVELADADLTNGSTITQVQRELNSLNSFLGKVINTAKDLLPTWTSNTIGASNNSVFARADALTAAVGANSGIAQLDVTGKLTASQIPTGLGGGGGGSLKWIEAANAPVMSVENNAEIYAFEAGLDQYLYADVRIPSGYTAGAQVSLKLTYYTSATSNTGLLTALSTLVRTGTDAITSTTNQRTSTNAAVTFSGSANLLRSVTFDLSSSIGEINSVAIAAGDLVRVRVTRGTDTSTADINALVFGAEPSFT
jgi:hypothetical protein